jgi:hypothetical protein
MPPSIPYRLVDTLSTDRYGRRVEKKRMNGKQEQKMLDATRTHRRARVSLLLAGDDIGLCLPIRLSHCQIGSAIAIYSVVKPCGFDLKLLHTMQGQSNTQAPIGQRCSRTSSQADAHQMTGASATSYSTTDLLQLGQLLLDDSLFCWLARRYRRKHTDGKVGAHAHHGIQRILCTQTKAEQSERDRDERPRAIETQGQHTTCRPTRPQQCGVDFVRTCNCCRLAEMKRLPSFEQQ